MDPLGLAIALAAGLPLAVAGTGAAIAATLSAPPRRTVAWAVSRGLPATPDDLPPGPAGPRPWSAWTASSAAARALPVWDIAGDDPAAPVVVLTHGWGDSRTVMLQRVPRIAPAASRILLWDLPGHGDAPGHTTLGIREPDALRALLEQALGPGSRAVLHGFSLGAGVSVVCAARCAHAPPNGIALAGVIAEAPYRFAHTPAANVMRARGWPAGPVLHAALALLGIWHGAGTAFARSGHGHDEPFDRADAAARIDCPLLVLHGSDDPVCPLDEARAIATAGRARLVVLPGARHNDLWRREPSATLAAAEVGAFLRAPAVRDYSAPAACG